MSKLYFITGAEGVGKSSIIDSLKDNFPDMDIHDFDEVGVPKNPSLEWRHNTTLYWLNTAIKNQEENKSTIIVGLSFPSEVKNYKEHKKMEEVLFCLLDVSEEERENRLKKRNAPKGLIEDLNQIRKLREEFKATESKSKTIDTTNISIEETAEKIIKWIKENE